MPKPNIQIMDAQGAPIDIKKLPEGALIVVPGTRTSRFVSEMAAGFLVLKDNIVADQKDSSSKALEVLLAPVQAVLDAYFQGKTDDQGVVHCEPIPRYLSFQAGEDRGTIHCWGVATVPPYELDADPLRQIALKAEYKMAVMQAVSSALVFNVPLYILPLGIGVYGWPANLAAKLFYQAITAADPSGRCHVHVMLDSISYLNDYRFKRELETLIKRYEAVLAFSEVSDDFLKTNIQCYSQHTKTYNAQPNKDELSRLSRSLILMQFRFSDKAQRDDILAKIGADKETFCVLSQFGIKVPFPILGDEDNLSFSVFGYNTESLIGRLGPARVKIQFPSDEIAQLFYSIVANQLPAYLCRLKENALIFYPECQKSKYAVAFSPEELAPPTFEAVTRYCLINVSLNRDETLPCLVFEFPDQALRDKFIAEGGVDQQTAALDQCDREVLLRGGTSLFLLDKAFPKRLYVRVSGVEEQNVPDVVSGCYNFRAHFPSQKVAEFFHSLIGHGLGVDLSDLTDKAKQRGRDPESNCIQVDCRDKRFREAGCLNSNWCKGNVTVQVKNFQGQMTLKRYLPDIFHEDYQEAGAAVASAAPPPYPAGPTTSALGQQCPSAPEKTLEEEVGVVGGSPNFFQELRGAPNDDLQGRAAAPLGNRHVSSATPNKSSATSNK